MAKCSSNNLTCASDNKMSKSPQVVIAEAALMEAKQTSQRHLQTKRELKTNLSELQKKLDCAVEDKHNTCELLKAQKEEFAKQVLEWDQFQSDLLTTVRVANDFKTEAQAQLEKTQQENSLLKHKATMLERKLNGENETCLFAGFCPV